LGAIYSSFFVATLRCRSFIKVVVKFHGVWPGRRVSQLMGQVAGQEFTLCQAVLAWPVWFASRRTHAATVSFEGDYISNVVSMPDIQLTVLFLMCGKFVRRADPTPPASASTNRCAAPQRDCTVDFAWPAELSVMASVCSAGQCSRNLQLPLAASQQAAMRRFAVSDGLSLVRRASVVKAQSPGLPRSTSTEGTHWLCLVW
jgi:hypothetical protein